MTKTLTIVGLGGSLAHTSRSLAVRRIALDAAHKPDPPMYNLGMVVAVRALRT